MAKFTYNNAKNIDNCYTLFELNGDYHPRIFFEDKVDPHLRSRLADKLA